MHESHTRTSLTVVQGLVSNTTDWGFRIPFVSHPATMLLRELTSSLRPSNGSGRESVTSYMNPLPPQTPPTNTRSNTYKSNASRSTNRSAGSGGARSGGSGGGSTSAFAGRGHTLGGGSSNAGGDGGNGVAVLQGLDPQTKILLCLLGGYALFWYLS